MRTLASLLLLMLAGCELGPPPQPEEPVRTAAPVVAPPGDAAGTTNTAWPMPDWWHGYGDATLSTLIGQALAQSPGIASAEARFGAARENVRVAGAANGLQVDVEAGYQRTRLSDTGLLPPEALGFNWYSQADLGIRARYDFDFWGRKQALFDAASSEALAAGAESQAAALALASAIAETYFGWQAEAARIALLDERLATLGQAAGIARQRETAGLDHGDDGERNRREQSAVRELRAQLEGSQALRRVLLAALLGVPGDALPPLTPQPLPPAPSALPPAVGLDLIARRPDIAASRLRVEAARLDLKAVRAEYYPDISIQALAGLSTIEMGTLFDAASGVPGFGVALHLPLFDAGLRDARHGAAGAQLTSAVAQYNETIVEAAREVGGAAAALTQVAAQRQQRELQLESAEALRRSAAARHRAGVTDLRPELDARLALLREQDARVQLDHAALVADIQLKEALGGGYVASELQR